MPWILITILVLIVVLFGVFLFWKKNKVAEARQLRFLVGGAIGGIVGSVVGIALVEFAGYSYPLPAILFFLGMAAGQLIGLLYQKLRE